MEDEMDTWGDVGYLFQYSSLGIKNAGSLYASQHRTVLICPAYGNQL